MKIGDFDRKGNVIRFYLVDDKCDDYWGDDWNDRPYEHNAGVIYEEYVKGYVDFYIPFDWLVVEAQDDWNYRSNSPFSKEDMKKRNVPCVVIVPRRVYENEWSDPVFSKYIGSDNVVKVYFEDTLEYTIKNIIGATDGYYSSVTNLTYDQEKRALFNEEKVEVHIYR